MSALMIVHLQRYALGFECHGYAVAVFRNDVPIVERVRHQRRSLNILHHVQVVPARPEIVVVARNTVTALSHFAVSHDPVAVLTPVGISRVDEVVQKVDILAKPPEWMSNKAIRAIVVPVGCIRRNRNNCFQAINPGGGRCQWKCSVIRCPGHSNLSGGPLCRHLLIPVNRCKALRASI